MNSSTSNNKTVATNTIFLFFRTIFLILIQLYTVPVVLRSLGTSDYGLYNVVGGIVTLFTVISSGLTSGSQRYLSFALGKGDSQKVKEVFATLNVIYLWFAIVILILTEVVGVWFLNTQINIDTERVTAANWCFQFSIFTFVTSCFNIPYNSALVAHEKMDFYAYISIFDGLSKLVIAFLLAYVSVDKLIFYGASIFACTIFQRLALNMYCRKQSAECRGFQYKWNQDIGKSLLFYSNWNILGSITILLKNQGLNVIQNLFFGTIVNAAHAIGNQIFGVINQMVGNIYMASRPRITKLYASNDKEQMWQVCFSSSKMAFYLLAAIMVPLFINIDYLLSLWLNEVPPYAADIAKLLLLSALIEALCNQLIAVYQASNQVKRFQMLTSPILLLNLPITYFLLKICGLSALSPYWVCVFVSLSYMSVVVYDACKSLKLSLALYAQKVLLPCISVFTCTLFMGLLSGQFMSSPLYKAVISIVLCLSTESIAVLTWGLSTKEKRFISNLISPLWKTRM